MSADSLSTPPDVRTSDKGLDDLGITVHKNTLNRWYQLMHLARLLDQKAENYVRQGKGWSYHSSFAGHDGIQLILGLSFRPNKDFLFPYYRELLTALAGGDTSRPVRDVLKRTCGVAHPLELLEPVFRRMEESGCPAIPVVNDGGRVVGMLTLENVGEMAAVHAALGRTAPR